MTFEPRTEIDGTTRTYWTTDKSEWERGPWDNEPDKIQWADQDTGLPCLMLRNGMGCWCGYVGVAEGHPWYEKDYNTPDVVVHGGLTFSAPCHEGADEAHAICHVPEPGEPDHVWWLGFDTSHAGDRTDFARPKEYRDKFPPLSFRREVYRDLEYAKKETTQLAKQVKEAANAKQDCSTHHVR